MLEKPLTTPVDLDVVVLCVFKRIYIFIRCIKYFQFLLSVLSRQSLFAVSSIDAVACLKSLAISELRCPVLSTTKILVTDT